MSSTNRGTSPRDSNRHDYYVTPVDEIIKFLTEFEKVEPNALNGLILDPCAGGDEIHTMSYPEALILSGVSWRNIYTVDIRKDSRADIIHDYLTFIPFFEPNLIITNPPFYIVQEIIEKALNDVRPGGFVAMLLRLNFFGSSKRKAFWRKNMPKYCFVHSKRMSFQDNGARDSIEYMHAVWQKGYSATFTQLKVI